MHHITRRLSPSTMIATVALIAATSGTAIAAGEIITSPNQIAFDVIQERHLQQGSVRSGQIEQQSVRKEDLNDPYFKVKVTKDGAASGSNNDTGSPGVQKVSTGTYDVTFNRALINGADGTFNESLFSKNCAVSAQARSGLFHTVVSGPTSLRPDTVRVQTAALDRTGQTTLFEAVDGAFDLIAVC